MSCEFSPADGGQCSCHDEDAEPNEYRFEFRAAICLSITADNYEEAERMAIEEIGEWDDGFDGPSDETEMRVYPVANANERPELIDGPLTEINDVNLTTVNPG